MLPQSVLFVCNKHFALFRTSSWILVTLRRRYPLRYPLPIATKIHRRGASTAYMKGRLMAHSTKRLFGVWIPYAAAAIMAFLVVGSFITGNVDSAWSWIEVSFQSLLAIYLVYYATKARRHIQ